MKPCARLSLLLSALAGSTASAYAHPGHEGHELTWDFGHLATHPGATVLCLAVLFGAAWAGWSLTRSWLDHRRQSLRGSQRSFGK